MPGIRVVVVDEHEIFRRGAVELLDATDSLDIVFSGEPDQLDGVVADVAVVSQAVAQQTQLRWPSVVCYADGKAPDLTATPNVYALLPRRSVTPHQLITSVHAAAAGLRISIEAPRGKSLGDRKREVMSLLASGADTREIASELGYSERTIKADIAEVSRNLGARTRAQAVAEAVRLNLI